jgi:hypothetical protein
MAKATAGVLLTILGLAIALLGACLVTFGLAGLFVGMHGGPLNALILTTLGLGPGFVGYVVARKGLSLARHTS